MAITGKREKTREVKLEVRESGEGDAKIRTVRVSVSSEAPVPETVFDSETGEWVRAFEVLGHNEGEIDFSRCADGLVIQDTHRGDQIGLIREPTVTDGKLGGEIEFCAGQRAQEIREDAERGLRRNMSIGYLVNEWQKVDNGDRKAGKLPTYRATSWTPYEASFVNVPADTRVGVDRAADISKNQTAAETAAITERNQEMPDPKNTPAVENPAADTAADTAAEVRGLKDEVAQLREALKKPEMPKPETARAFDAEEAKKVAKTYNIMNAIRALAGDKSVDCGFERECSEQIAKATGKSARGMFLPEEALRAFVGKTNVADHIVGNGAALVQTDLLSDQYIDALVAKTVFGQLGVGTLSGLVGDIAIPKGTAMSAAWLSAEDGSATFANPVFSQVTATPHTIAANTILSRKLMQQSSISVQGLVTRLIFEAIARGIETAGFEGTGSSGQPKGIGQFDSGIQSITMTANAPTYAQIVEFWRAVATANAMGQNMKFVGSPAVKALLAKTVEVVAVENKAKSDYVGGVRGNKLIADDGKVQGYDFVMSNLCNANKLYFADWSQMLLAFWSGIDLTVDPYSYSNKGALQLTAFQDCDVIVRHPEAFAIGTAISAE